MAEVGRIRRKQCGIKTGGEEIEFIQLEKEEWSKDESKFETEILIACSGATRRLFCVIMSVNAM